MKQMYPGIFWLKLEAEHFLLFVVVGNRSSSFLQNNTPRLLQSLSGQGQGFEKQAIVVRGMSWRCVVAFAMYRTRLGDPPGSCSSGSNDFAFLCHSNIKASFIFSSPQALSPTSEGKAFEREQCFKTQLQIPSAIWASLSCLFSCPWPPLYHYRATALELPGALISPLNQKETQTNK